jgi:hypothetical protein
MQFLVKYNNRGGAFPNILIINFLYFSIADALFLIISCLQVLSIR